MSQDEKNAIIFAAIMNIKTQEELDNLKAELFISQKFDVTFEDDCDKESCDWENDYGVMCHYSKTTGGWEQTQESCPGCNYRYKDCRCDDFNEDEDDEEAEIEAAEQFKKWQEEKEVKFVKYQEEKWEE